MRSCARILAAGVLAAASLLGSAGTAAGDRAPVAAAAMTALPSIPELAIDHRLPAGGMNLWRMPISARETGVGSPQLVRSLSYGGFSYDNSVVLAGDVGTVTPSDDGTPDYVIWHAQPNGGVLLWGVGGGGDTTPHLWADLRTGGWSYAKSRPMLGDVNGDGWDDLVVVHDNFPYGPNVWVFLSDGTRLTAPQLWTWNLGHPFGSDRYLLADLTGDGLADLVAIGMNYTSDIPSPVLYLDYMVFPNSGSSSFGVGYYHVFKGMPGGGWSLAGSRQLAGDVNGDGLTDLVTIHQQAGGGILVWVTPACGQGLLYCQGPTVVWQDLRTGGWSFNGSRQYLADVNADHLDDLITVHSQPGNPGELVWQALSTGAGFTTAQVMTSLMTGGWNFANSRETVAQLHWL